MTPRSTTWTPRYAWMPVRIRLATNGAARNASIDVSSTLFRPALLDGVDQQVQVVVEQLEVVRHLFRAPDRRRHDEHFAARAPADRVRRLQVEVRLDEHQLHPLP